MAVRGRGPLLVGAALCLAVFLAAPGASAQDEGAPVLPDSFAGAASAEAMGVAVLTPALVPVPGLFDLGFVEGRGTYESSSQDGRASIMFPGNGLIIGPNLLCGTFIGPQIPPEGEPLFGPILDACLQYQFPLAVFVDSLSPDAQTEGAVALGAPTDPISIGAAGARAHAGIDATTTEAEINDLDILGLPALGGVAPLFNLLGMEAPDTSLVRADDLTARTDERIVDGSIVVDAEATVTGLRLVGGLVRIGSIVSHSRLVSGPGAEPVIETTLEVGGVTVAGQPAQITEDGLVLGTDGPGSGPLVQQLTSAVAGVLQSSGFRITTLAEERGVDSGIPFAGVGGLLIEYSTPLANLPPIPGPIGDLDLNGSYGVRVQVGTTGVRGFADDFTAATPITRPPTTSGAGGGVGSAGSAGSSGSPGSSGSTGSAGTPAATTPTTAAPVAEVEETSFLDDLFAERLAFLYLSFTLAAIALCVAPRLSLPARLPAARS